MGCICIWWAFSFYYLHFIHIYTYIFYISVGHSPVRHSSPVPYCKQDDSFMSNFNFDSPQCHRRWNRPAVGFRWISNDLWFHKRCISELKINIYLKYLYVTVWCFVKITNKDSISCCISALVHHLSYRILLEHYILVYTAYKVLVWTILPCLGLIPLLPHLEIPLVRNFDEVFCWIFYFLNLDQYNIKCFTCRK